jgi:pimeloyl-ACP methyl ester carboxylesterase
VLVLGCTTEPNRLECEADVDLISTEDRDALFAVPEAPIGVVVLFHGLSEQACNWVDKVEEDRVADAALARGFAWVAPDGADAAWETDLDNDEIGSVDAVLATLESDGLLPSELPTMTIGHSNGGAFSQVYAVGSERGVVAAVNANGWGTAALGATMSPPPMLFITAENDSVVSSGVVLDAANTAQNRGHDVTTILHARSRLADDRFARIEGIDDDDSASIVAAFEDTGLLDDAGRPAANPRTDSRYGDAIPDAFEPSAAHIQDQLHVVFAEHRFSSADIDRIFDLFTDATEQPSAARVQD